jgi:ribose-phosphate pyrophosphokinase
MNPVLIAGQANPALADSIAARLGSSVGRCTITRFPDTELHVEILETVRGADVYLIQPTGPPVDQHLMELLFLADACWRAGAGRVTAVVPYFGYARQDRRASGRDAIGGRIVSALISTVGIQRVMAFDLHNAAIEGFFAVPLEHFSAVELLANAFVDSLPAESVVVAPDLGAVKLATRFAGLLHLPVAIVHKTRLSGEAVSVQGIVGEVRGRAPIIVDDMISTGATIEAAVRARRAANCAADISVAATHALMVAGATGRLTASGIRRLVVSDSLASAALAAPLTQVVSIAPMLAEAISRLNIGESLSDLLSHR